LLTVITGAGIGLSWQTDHRPAEVRIDPEVQYVTDCLRGEQVDVTTAIENATGDRVRIVDSQTSCGCANLTVGGNFEPQNDEAALSGLLYPGKSRVQLSIDSTGKTKGEHDFQFAFLLEDAQMQEQILDGFVTVDVRHGLKVVPQLIYLSPGQRTFEVNFYSDTSKVKQLKAIRISHPDMIDVTLIDDIAEGPTLEGFDFLGACQIEIDSTILQADRNEYFWIDFVGEAPTSNVSRVVLRPRVETENPIRAIPPTGLTLIGDRTGTIQGSFLLAIWNDAGEPTVTSSHSGVTIEKTRLDRGTWSVDIGLSSDVSEAKIELSISLGAESFGAEPFISYPVNVIRK